MKYFITFASESHYKPEGRLLKQANDCRVFDMIIGYTERYLKEDPEFWEKHSTFVEKNKRGYGYWIWKPYVIKKTMERIKDGDYLLYLDSGCEIGNHRHAEFKELFDIVKRDLIVGTSTGHIERRYCKKDLFLKMEMDERHMQTMQNQAGALCFIVCDQTRELVNQWYDLCCQYHLVDDSPSIEKNYEDFIDHRHDQSILSLLTKKRNLFSKDTLSRFPIYYKWNKTEHPTV